MEMNFPHSGDPDWSELVLIHGRPALMVWHDFNKQRVKLVDPGDTRRRVAGPVSVYGRTVDDLRAVLAKEVPAPLPPSEDR